MTGLRETECNRASTPAIAPFLYLTFYKKKKMRGERISPKLGKATHAYPSYGVRGRRGEGGWRSKAPCANMQPENAFCATL